MKTKNCTVWSGRFSVPCLPLIILHFYSTCSLADSASNTYEACPGERIMHSIVSCFFLDLLRYLMLYSWRLPYTRVWAHSKVALKSTHFLRDAMGFSPGVLYISFWITPSCLADLSLFQHSVSNLLVLKKNQVTRPNYVGYFHFCSPLWWTSTILPTISQPLRLGGRPVEIDTPLEISV